jgi:hypothetical protein
LIAVVIFTAFMVLRAESGLKKSPFWAKADKDRHKKKHGHILNIAWVVSRL